MMLLNDFYQITEQASQAFRIRLNPAHEIYRAHFPGQPITPGVCQIQLVTELLSQLLDAEATLTDCKNVKYLSVVRPEETPELTVRFAKLACEEDTCRASVVLEDGDRVFSKMSLTCHVVRRHTDLQ
ncbi:MAG TPA: hypothetical protein H9814_07075 [Candidatus Bacteroides merdigallinarum]|uniref:ApeI dehydratase-like domain-containing protein n=1 Tax=Candidatus Bacteroides merdigallinarum TaxID=2838473 RepID=A0A9D2E8T3_9BACE|nr:hypothetical protein [Candidatus Bacteroides merdigallinarum]